MRQTRLDRSSAPVCFNCDEPGTSRKPLFRDRDRDSLVHRRCARKGARLVAYDEGRDGVVEAPAELERSEGGDS